MPLPAPPFEAPALAAAAAPPGAVVECGACSPATVELPGASGDSIAAAAAAPPMPPHRAPPKSPPKSPPPPSAAASVPVSTGTPVSPGVGAPGVDGTTYDQSSAGYVCAIVT